MKKTLLLVCFCGVLNVVFAQLSYQFTKYDFGELDRETVRWVDLEVENKGGKDIFILRVESSRAVKYRVSQNVIMPDSIGFVRLFIDPFETGDFKETINIWTSNSKKPQAIVLKAEVLETNTLALQSCPDFGDVNPYKIAFELAVIVKDAEGNKIQDASVVVARSSAEAFKGKTDKKGKVLVKGAAIGLYRVQTKLGNQIASDEMIYFNRQNPVHVVTLKTKPVELVAEEVSEQPKRVKQQKTSAKPKESPIKPIEQPVVKKDPPPVQIKRVEVDVPENSTSMVDAAIAAELKKMDTLTTSTNLIDDAIERELAAQEQKTVNQKEEAEANEAELIALQKQADNDPEDFSRLEYLPNNIVFLIDVSTSMRYLERIDLLKISLIALSTKLRDIDYMAMVTYASSANTILNATKGTEKQTIDSLIWSLEARGTTASDKGLDKAYEVAEKAFIGEGNNQIILITDGAFDAKSLYRLIRKKAKEQITLSVVGIKAEKHIAAELEEMAVNGQGTFVNVLDLTQAKTVLVSEIKKNSKKR